MPIPAPMRPRRASVVLLCPLLACALSSFAATAQAQTQTQAPAQQPATTLSPVKVEAEAASDLKVDEASVTRSGASILDTPLTLNVIPVDLTLAQAAQTIGDVVRNSASARPASYFGTYESVYARGFWMQTTTNFLRNGFRFIHLNQPAKRNVERYELIKGPAGLDYGRVEPGALMNIVSKRPLESAYREITLVGGANDGWDAGFDITGPLNDAGTILYRLNAGTGRQAFVSDAVDPRTDDVAAALTFKPGENTRIDLDFEYADREQLIYPGLPVPDPLRAESADALSLDNFYGEAAGTFEGHHKLFTGRVEHRFDDSWSANIGYSRNITYRNVKQVRITGVSGNTVTRGANPFSQEFDVETIQAELKGDLQFGTTRHLVTLTADRAGYERDGSNNNFGTVAPTTLVDPMGTGATFTYGPVTTSEVRDNSVALQDYIELLPQLNALIGVRYTRYDENNPNVPEQSGDSTDPTAALIYKPRPWISVYGSYATSFLPNSGTLLAPNVYAPPSSGEQVEVGTKQDWLDGRLRTSAAVYEIRKTDVPTPSPVDPLFNVLSGEIRARGVEFEAVGEVTAGWNLIASYGYVDAEIVRDNVASNVGRTPSQTPAHTASLWSTYALGGNAAGWTVGGGVFYTGSKFVSNNNLVAVPGYVITDLMAEYAFERGLPGAALQVNLRNVFDERHYEGGGSGAAGFTNLYPGLSRTLSVSLTFPF